MVSQICNSSAARRKNGYIGVLQENGSAGTMFLFLPKDLAVLGGNKYVE